MRWINIETEADLPKVSGKYVVEDKSGYKQSTYFANEETDIALWKRYKRWLDETEERMFTVEEMRKAFFDGEYNGAIGEFGGVPIHETDYFKETFNIDL
jgi:hypothetical protein